MSQRTDRHDGCISPDLSLKLVFVKLVNNFWPAVRHSIKNNSLKYMPKRGGWGLVLMFVMGPHLSQFFKTFFILSLLSFNTNMKYVVKIRS